MSTEARSSGVPRSIRCPIVAQAPYTAVDFSAKPLNRAAKPAHTAIPLSSCIFCMGELDGAEGFDGAET